MRFGSVCSGVEAASIAWQPLGWKAQFFSEIDKFPSAVLNHHYPDVPNYGDMTKFKEWNAETIDLLVGGTPCQSFSIAGLRKGMEDPRGNLSLTYIAMADRFKPKWVVWENVPGVLSSNKGRDFGTFISALGEIGYGFSWRILDAQYFGVPQRRRRLFVVGHLGNWKRAAEVLFEPESLSGHPAPSREASEVSSRVFPCLTGGGPGSLREEEGYVIEVCGGIRHLTPIECERLQGFPDNYTQIPWRNKASEDCPIGPRYKAMGNSMAVPVMRWIGERIHKKNNQ